jgi:hypothetical protein
MRQQRHQGCTLPCRLGQDLLQPPVQVVDQLGRTLHVVDEEAPREPLVDVGAGDRDRRIAHDVTLGAPPAHQRTEARAASTSRCESVVGGEALDAEG